MAGAKNIALALLLAVACVSCRDRAVDLSIRAESSNVTAPVPFVGGTPCLIGP